MTHARTKSKTVKKKSGTTKKKPAPKKKPVAKKSPPKPIAKPDKKKVAKPDAHATKPDAKKGAAAKGAAPSARDHAHAGTPARFQPTEARAKKAPKVRPSRAREPGKRPDLPIPTPVERPGGAAGQFGEKYVCFSCGAKFYDLGKPEPRCPKCGADQREAPRQPKPSRITPAAAGVVEERPVKRSRLLDEDEDEIVIDPDADAVAVDLDLGLGVVEEGEDFGTDEPEEEEEPEEP